MIQRNTRFRRTFQTILKAGWIAAAMTAILLAGAPIARGETNDFVEVVRIVQPKIVKIYGAGGLRGLESYQSGFLVSGEGHILTVWSYVLDSDVITVILDDGRRFEAELVGAAPQQEVAVLKVGLKDAEHFDLKQAIRLSSGRRVLAFSNLFGVATGDEPASVLHGVVAAVAPLSARRGVFESAFQGDVYIVDAMTNNPGAAGGALTDRRGALVGLIGKELRNSADNTWLNYAIPIEHIATAVADVIAGKGPPPRNDDPLAKRPDEPFQLQQAGVVLVPDVLAKTPPYVDHVLPGSPAEKAGVKPDDLILFVNGRIAGSCKDVRKELGFIDRIDPVKLTLKREQQLIEVELRTP